MTLLKYKQETIFFFIFSYILIPKVSLTNLYLAFLAPIDKCLFNSMRKDFLKNLAHTGHIVCKRDITSNLPNKHVQIDGRL